MVLNPVTRKAHASRRLCGLVLEGPREVALGDSMSDERVTASPLPILSGPASGRPGADWASLFACWFCPPSWHSS